MTHGVAEEQRRGTGPAKRRSLHRLYKPLVVAFSLAFLAPNLWAIVEPYEDWPYTSLPMYAHYVDRHTPRYKFIFLGELDGLEQELTTYDVGVDYAAMRFFFSHVYGSMESAPSPFSRFPNDTKRDFEDRLSRFFAAYAQRHRQRFPRAGLTGVRLQVARLRWEHNAVDELHELGRHDVRSGRFTHTWPVSP